ncbi:hypothetical protein GGI04_002760 [Coemansia thaxteri]|nr:hypothetical protein GGI04_002760 [Coemansia thaxteri]
MPTGKLKTKAPNAFMLFRLHAVKPLKGTRMTAGEINQSISNKWNQMPQEEKDLYKLLSRKIQSQLDIMNSRVPAKTKCVEQVQILVPDLLRASTDSSNCYTQISKFGSVNVLQPLELDPGTPQIVEFQPDESGVGLLYPSITVSRSLRFGFPLKKPSWSVGTLLQRPVGISHQPVADQTLGHDEIQHLYHLAGLKMPDPIEQPQEYAQVLKDVNQLRDFLSHLRVVSESENLSLVQPLARFAEPVVFSAAMPGGGLKLEKDESTELGTRVLQTAARTSGQFLVVED